MSNTKNYHFSQSGTPQKFCNRIKEVRTEQKMSQKQLAQLISCSRNSIVSIENGNFEPTGYTCAMICKALNVSYEDLFWVEDIHFGDIDELLDYYKDLKDYDIYLQLNWYSETTSGKIVLEEDEEVCFEGEVEELMTAIRNSEFGYYYYFETLVGDEVIITLNHHDKKLTVNVNRDSDDIVDD